MTGIINPGSWMDRLAVTCWAVPHWLNEIIGNHYFLKHQLTWHLWIIVELKESSTAAGQAASGLAKQGGWNQVIASSGSANLHTVPSLPAEQERWKISNSKSPVSGRYWLCGWKMRLRKEKPLWMHITCNKSIQICKHLLGTAGKRMEHIFVSWGW